MLILVLALFILLVFNGNLVDLLCLLLRVELVLYVIRAVKVWAHVIMLILILEFFRIGGFIACSIVSTRGLNPLAIFLFAVVIVCEARMGIGLIVGLTRGRGDEMIRV